MGLLVGLLFDLLVCGFLWVILIRFVLVYDLFVWFVVVLIWLFVSLLLLFWFELRILVGLIFVGFRLFVFLLLGLSLIVVCCLWWIGVDLLFG